MSMYLPMYYLDSKGLSPGLFAIGFALARLVDPLSGPLIGWLSDNHTHTSVGRRYPWIAAGALINAAALIALFCPPDAVNGDLLILWLTFFNTIYFVSMAMYWIPYNALAGEYTQDYDERTNILAWREIFAIPGTLHGLAMPPILSTVLSDDLMPHKWTIYAGSLAFITVVTFFTCMIGLPPPPSVENDDGSNSQSTAELIPAIHSLSCNRPFCILVPVFFLCTLGVATLGTMLPFYVRYVLSPADPQQWLGYMFLVMMVAYIPAIPLITWMSQVLDKLATYYILFSISLTAFLFCLVYDKGATLPL